MAWPAAWPTACAACAPAPPGPRPGSRSARTRPGAAACAAGCLRRSALGVGLRGERGRLVDELQRGGVGDAGPHRQHLLAQRGRVQRHVARHFGPRPDQAHVAGDHVDQLRQLVDAIVAQPAAGACDARIGQRGHGRPLCRCIDPHRAQLVDAKDLAVAAHPLLAKHRGPAGVPSHPAGSRQQQRRQQRPAPSAATMTSNSRLAISGDPTVCLDRSNDALDIGIGHARVDRQAHLALVGPLAVRKHLRRQVVAIAPIRLQVQRDVVHAAADAALEQALDQAVARDRGGVGQAQRVQMPGVQFAGRRPRAASARAAERTPALKRSAMAAAALREAVRLLRADAGRSRRRCRSGCT